MREDYVFMREGGVGVKRGVQEGVVCPGGGVSKGSSIFHGGVSHFSQGHFSFFTNMGIRSMRGR